MTQELKNIVLTFLKNKSFKVDYLEWSEDDCTLIRDVEFIVMDLNLDLDPTPIRYHFLSGSLEWRYGEHIERMNIQSGSVMAHAVVRSKVKTLLFNYFGITRKFDLFQVR